MEVVEFTWVEGYIKSNCSYRFGHTSIQLIHCLCFDTGLFEMWYSWLSFIINLQLYNTQHILLKLIYCELFRLSVLQ